MPLFDSWFTHVSWSSLVLCSSRRALRGPASSICAVTVLGRVAADPPLLVDGRGSLRAPWHLELVVIPQREPAERSTREQHCSPAAREQTRSGWRRRHCP